MVPRTLLRMTGGATLADGGDRLRIQSGRHDGSELGVLPAGVRTALLALNGGGATENELLAAVSRTDGASASSLLYYALHDLAGRGLLAHCATGAGPLASVNGRSPLADGQRRATADATYAFSRTALIRRSGSIMLAESARSSAQVVIHDPRVLSLIALPGTPRPLAEIDTAACGLTSGEVTEVVSLLLTCGMVEENGAEEDGPVSYWELPDMLLHARSRVGRHLGGYGGTYALRDRFPAPPATKPPMSGEPFELFTPDVEWLAREDMPFTGVLEGRRSTRHFGDPPIDRRQLGELLYRAARQRGAFSGDSGQELGSRPYPAGGGIYELEIYLAVDACQDLPRGFYHYHPAEHRLYRLTADEAVVRTFVQSARGSSGSTNPQVVLTIAARFDRFFWKYESIRYAAILKNVGVLYQTLYLVAEAMGLGACALGGGESDYLSEVTGLDYYTESAVGEFMVGSRAS
ncbi:MAG: hypothetical protein QOH21_14 [Acidobacteriota bacterium]|nr:hypothetical protein [Acidobacteriota bacterium]